MNHTDATTAIFRAAPTAWDELDDALDRTIATRQAAGEDIYVNALSAGCSRGYEAYSLAAFLHEWTRLRPEQFTVTGIDVDPALVARARTGRVPARDLRDALRNGYVPVDVAARTFPLEPAPATAVSFAADPTGTRPRSVRLAARLRDRLKFHVGDLNHPAHMPDDLTVVFAANVWRHLTDTGRYVLARELHQRMRPDGLLVIGGADFYDATGDGTVIEKPEWSAGIRRYFEPAGEFLYRPSPTEAARA